MPFRKQNKSIFYPKKKSEADTEAINNKLNTALSEESNKTSKLMRAKRRSYFLRILFPTILLLPCFIPFFSGLYSIIALLGGIVYILFSFIKKLIKREIDDLGRTLIITSLLIFLSLFAYCCLIDNFSFILDIVFWAITIFLLCRPVKRKYIDKLLVLNSDKTVSKLQSSLKDKQETANIEQTRLIKKLGLYTEMQFDAEKDDGGATLIKNYLNSKYLQKS